MSDEIWKDIEGYEGIYQVSSHGRVKSLDRVSSHGRRLKGTHLKTLIDSNNCLRVGFCKDGKKTSKVVYTLVIEAFVGKRSKYEIVLFRDKNSLNANLDNLYYGARREQHKNSPLGKGVFFNKNRGMYYSCIKHMGERYNLGSFKTKEEASDAYDRAAIISDKKDGSFEEFILKNKVRKSRKPSSVYNGVSKIGARWRTRVNDIYVGTFDTEQEAKEAYLQASEIL